MFGIKQFLQVGGPLAVRRFTATGVGYSSYPQRMFSTTSKSGLGVLANVETLLEQHSYHRAAPLLQQLLDPTNRASDYSHMPNEDQARANLLYAKVLSNGSLDAYLRAKDYFKEAIALDPGNSEIEAAAEAYDASLLSGKDGLVLHR